MKTRALLLDIEGTTTPVSFVYETLFPYARARLRDFLEANREREDVIADIRALGVEHEAEQAEGASLPAWRGDLDSAVAYLTHLMDRDRKSTALKSVQGKIWEDGYRRGELRGLVYDDVPRAFERWQSEGRQIAIFSSGSVLAQQLIFAHTNHGDLTPFLSGYFDTTTGPKREAESYRRIAAALGFEPPEILFCSDVVAELDAAQAAGMQTALCVREGEAPDQSSHPIITSFDELELNG